VSRFVPFALGVPGDKSIAHRAILVAMLSHGESRIDGVPAGADVRSSARCAAMCGARVDYEGTSTLRVRGLGEAGPAGDLGELDCGNSGTTMRLLTGILAGRRCSAVLVGDESLSRRPMRRVVVPLEAMGAKITTRDGMAPVALEGRPLTGRHHVLEVASAQLKSALLFAGLAAVGTTSVEERELTRDHTERMFASLGLPIRREGLRVAIDPVARIPPLRTTIPGDFSSAAFWVALGAFGPRRIRVRGVGVNPTRTGLLDVLERAGARIELATASTDGGIEGAEPVADIEIEPGHALAPFDVSGLDATRTIDELPLLMILAAMLPGVSRFRNAGELRVKESDRIAAVARGLIALGAGVREHPDGIDVTGGRPLRAARVESEGDHRIAIGFAVLAAVADLKIEIGDAGAARVSYPEIYTDLERAGLLRARLA